MIKKILNSKTKSVAWAAGLIAFSSFLSRLLSIVRDRLLASTFGAGESLDMYFAAFRAPDFLRAILVTAGIGVAFLPVFSEEFEKNRKKAFLFTNNLLNFFLVFIGIFSLLGMILAPFLVGWVAPGFTSAQRAKTVVLIRILFLTPILFAISSVFSGVLQYFDRFLLYSLTPFFYNLGVIGGIIFLAPRFGLEGLAFGAVLGAVAHCLIQLPGVLKEGFKWKPFLTFKNYRLKKVLEIMGPSSIGALFLQMTWLVVTALASRLPSGSIAIFNLSKNLGLTPVSLIGAPLSVAVFPLLSRKWAQGDKEGFWKEFAKVFRMILFLALPLGVLIFVLRAQVVRLILGGGKWGWRATRLSAASLGVFAWALFASCFILLFKRVLYSLQKPKTPALSEGVNFIVTVSLSFLLLGWLAPGGVLEESFSLLLKVEGNIQVLAFPLALALATIVQFLFLLYFLIKETKTKEELEILASFGKTAVLSLLSGLTSWVLLRPLSFLFPLETFWNVFLQAGFSSFAGISFYLLSAWLLDLPELDLFVSELKKGLFEKYQAGGYNKGRTK